MLDYWAWQTPQLLHVPAGTFWLLLGRGFALHVSHERGIDDGLQRQPLFTCHTSHIDAGRKNGESTRLIFHYAAPYLVISHLPLVLLKPSNGAVCHWKGAWLRLPSLWLRDTVEQHMGLAGFCLGDQGSEKNSLKRWMMHSSKTWFHCGANPAESSMRRLTTCLGNISGDLLH